MALGVEKLKVVLVALIHLGNKLDEVTQDGYQVVPDTIALIPNLGDVVGVIKFGKEALAEFKDLDDFEKQEVLDYINNELDILDDELEGIIEDALKLMALTQSFVKRVGAAVKK